MIKKEEREELQNKHQKHLQEKRKRKGGVRQGGDARTVLGFRRGEHEAQNKQHSLKKI